MFPRDINKSVFLSGLIPVLLFLSCSSADTQDCALINKDSASEKTLLEGLRDLKGETVSVEEKVDGKLKNVYEIAFCANVNKSLPQVGALQHSIGEKTNETILLGYYNATRLVGSVDGGWTLITYKNGDKYNGSCQNNSREMQLMVVCDPTAHHGSLQIGNTGAPGGTSCSYMFVLGSSVLCKKANQPQHHGLSGGTVFCILFFTAAGGYLLLGFLYKRMVVGAKGLEQIPNYSFWKDFGNLQADGCNYFCRCQCDTTSDHHAYRDIDDRPARGDMDRDDQLLTM